MTTGQFSEPYTIPAHNNSMVNRRQLQLFKHQINSDSPATSWYVELTVQIKDDFSQCSFLNMSLCAVYWLYGKKF